MVVPAGILWFSRDTGYRWQVPSVFNISFWLGIVCAVTGLVLMAWTISDFSRIGKGTLAPWEPTRKLIVSGPYRHVRNPMITGVMFILLAESVMFQSWPIAVWLAIFTTLNLFYMLLSEEKGLEKRFGEEYRVYKKNVPRWIPRWTPWSPSGK